MSQDQYIITVSYIWNSQFLTKRKKCIYMSKNQFIFGDVLSLSFSLFSWSLLKWSSSSKKASQLTYSIWTVVAEGFSKQSDIKLIPVFICLELVFTSTASIKLKGTLISQYVWMGGQTNQAPDSFKLMTITLIINQVSNKTRTFT